MTLNQDIAESGTRGAKQALRQEVHRKIKEAVDILRSDGQIQVKINRAQLLLEQAGITHTQMQDLVIDPEPEPELGS